ncbi:hypothetical protein FHG87_021255 [Trinorchestia longiramus]|nr:hypothetical protein FHG87_021255 [Trinorchestia longiramus]
MRRSSAPSQLAKKPRFTPPLRSVENFVGKRDATLDKAVSPARVPLSGVVGQECSSEVTSTRTTEDILSLFSESSQLNSELKASSSVQYSGRTNENGTYDISSAGLHAGKQLLASDAEVDSTIKFTSENTLRSTAVNHTRKNQNILKVCQKENGSSEAVGFHAQSEAVSNERYFSVVWCKRSNRKHKKWEGDAVLIVRTRSVLLKDMEGKVIGQSSGYKMADLTILEDGNTLPVGGKEVEIQGIIPEAEYSSGRCFLSATSATVSAVTTPPLPRPKPFKLPTRGSAKSAPTTTHKPCNDQPLYAGHYTHSLLFPRPTARQQLGESSRNVVDVVLDPHLSSKLRPHQREGVIFLYRCVMGHTGVSAHNDLKEKKYKDSTKHPMNEEIFKRDLQKIFDLAHSSFSLQRVDLKNEYKECLRS